MKTPSLHKSIENVILDKKAEKFAIQRAEKFFKSVTDIISRTNLPLNDNSVNLVAELLNKTQIDYMNLLNGWKEMQEKQQQQKQEQSLENEDVITEVRSHAS